MQFQIFGGIGQKHRGPGYDPGPTGGCLSRFRGKAGERSRLPSSEWRACWFSFEPVCSLWAIRVQGPCGLLCTTRVGARVPYALRKRRARAFPLAFGNGGPVCLLWAKRPEGPRNRHLRLTDKMHSEIHEIIHFFFPYFPT